MRLRPFNVGRFQQRPAQVILPPSPRENNNNNRAGGGNDDGGDMLVDQDLAMNNNQAAGVGAAAEQVCFLVHELYCRKRSSLAVLRGIPPDEFQEFILRCANCNANIPTDQPSFACERAQCNKDFCLACCG